MPDCPLPAAQAIQEVFAAEVIRLGGQMTDEYRHDELLLLRSVTTHTEHVRPGDAIQGGVALRTSEQEIFVHPYTFRQVCRNGAIVAQVMQAQCIMRVDSDASPEDVDEVLQDVRLAVQMCMDPASLRDSVYAMQYARRMHGNLSALISMLSTVRFSKSLISHLLQAITQRFEQSRERSMYGLMNAITSLARDTRDPQTRWQLEELGGTIPALVHPIHRLGGTTALPWAESRCELPEEQEEVVTGRRGG
ncbi:MAG: hypothetical protein ACYC4U_17255 [Pirellulaceae bacterium]